jgi:hypothetical protein
MCSTHSALALVQFNMLSTRHAERQIYMTPGMQVCLQLAELTHPPTCPPLVVQLVLGDVESTACVAVASFPTFWCVKLHVCDVSYPLDLG